MFDLLKARLGHGYQAIPNPLQATIHPSFPGVACIMRADEQDFDRAAEQCPSQAIGNYCLDMGKCVFCGECSRRFPDTFAFKPDFRMASSSREGLIVRWQAATADSTVPEVAVNQMLKRLFRHSFALRNVSAGGCNACELELNATANVNFDMGRYGLEIVASPRHADGLILTGPVTVNMAFALKETWEAIPEPKVLILCGSCAISGGLFADTQAIDRTWLQGIPAVLYIPGCPAHPLSIIHGIMALLGRAK